MAHDVHEIVGVLDSARALERAAEEPVSRSLDRARLSIHAGVLDCHGDSPAPASIAGEQASADLSRRLAGIRGRLASTIKPIQGSFLR